jgi:hypothetical protein
MDAFRTPSTSRTWRTQSVLVLVGVTLALSSGCASRYGAVQPASPTSTGSTPMQKMASSQSATGSADADVETCGACATKSKAPVVLGTPATENGVQIVNVGLVSGFYSPNHFTVKSGVPVTVRFSGKAKGCLGHPVFKSLGKKVDLTSGSATINLGMLKPGTYEFSCSMGMGAGSIVVQ